jgi:hypothetical protein
LEDVVDSLDVFCWVTDLIVVDFDLFHEKVMIDVDILGSEVE